MKRNLLAAVLLLTLAAHADPYLGVIRVYDGGSANNVTTTCLDAGFDADGGVITDGGPNAFMYAGCGFNIAPGTWITAQSATDCHVNTDVKACAVASTQNDSVAPCPRLMAYNWLSMPATKKLSLTYVRPDGILLYDGGLSTSTQSYNGAFVSVSPADGGSTCSMFIWGQLEKK